VSFNLSLNNQAAAATFQRLNPAGIFAPYASSKAGPEVHQQEAVGVSSNDYTSWF